MLPKKMGEDTRKHPGGQKQEAVRRKNNAQREWFNDRTDDKEINRKYWIKQLIYNQISEGKKGHGENLRWI